jgi:hypothetical protein
MGGKTLNNNRVPLRGVFEFAKRDRAIAANPAGRLEKAPIQQRPPDPFTLDEVNTILGWFIDNEHEQVHNYFAAAFFAGFRPSEQIALHTRRFANAKYFSGKNNRGGERGIRTLDTGFGPYAPLAGECLRPLGHLSDLILRPFRSLPRAERDAQCSARDLTRPRGGRSKQTPRRCASAVPMSPAATDPARTRGGAAARRARDISRRSRPRS